MKCYNYFNRFKKKIRVTNMIISIKSKIIWIKTFSYTTFPTYTAVKYLGKWWLTKKGASVNTCSRLPQGESYGWRLKSCQTPSMFVILLCLKWTLSLSSAVCFDPALLCSARCPRPSQHIQNSFVNKLTNFWVIIWGPHQYLMTLTEIGSNLLSNVQELIEWVTCDEN